MSGVAESSDTRKPEELSAAISRHSRYVLPAKKLLLGLAATCCCIRQGTLVQHHTSTAPLAKKAVAHAALEPPWQEMATSVSLQWHCWWMFGVLKFVSWFSEKIHLYHGHKNSAQRTALRLQRLDILMESGPAIARLLRSSVFLGKPHHPPNPPWHRDVGLHQLPPTNPPVNGVHRIPSYLRRKSCCMLWYIMEHQLDTSWFPVGQGMPKLNLAKSGSITDITMVENLPFMVPWPIGFAKTTPPPVLLRPPLPWSLPPSGRWCNPEVCCWGLSEAQWWGHGYSRN